SSLLLFSAIISIDSIGHSFHSFLIVSFPISFLTSQNVYRIIPMALNFHLLTYFSSGFWKLALLLREVFAWNFYSYSKSALSNAMTKKALELSRSLSLVDAFVAMPSFLSVTLWLVVVLFQVGMIYFVIKSYYPKYLGILIISFHSLTLFLMDINYMEAQALTCILFFCGVPLIKKSEKEATDTSLKPA
ncbi:MAG: hypothetical protein NXH75_18445, partial [Halobacteriovoraceae bacterium]|nr:hypothetical protein [Halobacteriovoraceae bacterium]